MSGWVHLLSALVLQAALIGSALIALHVASWFVFAVLFASSLAVLLFAVAGSFTLRPTEEASARASRRFMLIEFFLLVVLLAVANLLGLTS